MTAGEFRNPPAPKRSRSMRPIQTLCRAALLAALLSFPQAQGAFPTVVLKPVCLRQIHSPTNIVSAADGTGRLFICDQPGRIHIFQGGMLQPTPFLDLSSTAGGPVLALTTGYSERGLLGLAFHPNYNGNPLLPGYGKFYVNYTKNYVAGSDPAPSQAGDPVNCLTVIAEFTVSAGNPNVAVPASERRLLMYTQPQSNHNGGQLAFGPDGYLYIGVGDGGGSNDNQGGHTGGSNSPIPTNNLGNGQDKTRYLGKILRIDPVDPDGGGPLTYSIPASNPFFSDPTPGLKKEIYAFGMRNPWRFSFDQRAGGTNRMFCGDVGQGRIEEINLIVSGGNYGWRYKEGIEMPTFSSGAPTNPMPDPGGPYIDPIAMYAHPGVTTSPVLPQLGLSVTGGFVYRGGAIPALQGKYIFGDYGSTAGASDGRMMGLEETAPGSGDFTLTQAIPFLGTSNPVIGQRILCLGEDESGEIYVGMKSNAGVLALDGGLPAGGIYKIVPSQSFNTSLPAAKDNTIFAEDIPLGRSYSDALGYLYAGRTGDNYGPYVRRALVAFDVAAVVPAGAVIQSAQLKLNLNKAGSTSTGTSVALHRLTETWGEGTSINPVDGGYGAPATTDDATWLWRFYNTSPWTAAGGSFAVTPSASAVLPDIALVTWGPTPQLQADVQGWLDIPAGNAGWILLGDEITALSASRFDSRQKGVVPPALQLTYGTAPPLTRRESWLQQYFLVGQFVDDHADLEGDGIVNLIEYAYGFSPLAANPPSAGLQVTSGLAGQNTVCTTTFRRDPRATDLSYFLETGSDLTGWTIITQSLAGAAPTGSGYVSESVVAGEAPIRLVQAQETLPSPVKHFVRLRVVRQP